MKRARPLRADPAKTFDWQKRSRQRAVARSRERPRKPLKQGKPKRKARIPAEVRARVLARSEGRCVRPGCPRRARRLHHVLEEQHFPEVAQCEDNLVGVCDKCHGQHHAALPRLPIHAVPSCALALARRLGGKAVSFIERTYPAPGGTGQLREESDG